MTRFVLLELEINGHTEKIDIMVTDLNGTNMFLGYDWLVSIIQKLTGTKGQCSLQDAQKNAKYNIRTLYLHQGLEE